MDINDVIDVLNNAKARYIARYKELYANYISAEKLSDEAKGSYRGRFAELNYILIDLFGVSGHQIQEIEDLIKCRYENLNGGANHE